MTFFVRPTIRPPANSYKNDGGGGGRGGGGVQNSCIPKWPIVICYFNFILELTLSVFNPSLIFLVLPPAGWIHHVSPVMCL